MASETRLSSVDFPLRGSPYRMTPRLLDPMAFCSSSICSKYSIFFRKGSLFLSRKAMREELGSIIWLGRLSFSFS
jgi:hypothetical protein